APSGAGLLYRTHSPALTMIACPAPTSNSAFLNLTCRLPRSTTVYSSNSGVCPGSDQPDGLFMRAMLTAVVPEFTRPMNSSISFGGCPTASITVGFWIYVVIVARSPCSLGRCFHRQDRQRGRFHVRHAHWL